jgi:hypothetical protein
MTYGTQLQYPVNVLGDIEKTNSLYCLISKASDFEKRDYYHRIYKTSCAEISICCLKKNIKLKQRMLKSLRSYTICKW